MDSKHPLPKQSLNVTVLSQRCAEETARFRQKKEHDPGFCYELFRRALELRSEAAWSAVYSQYHRLVRHWLGSAPGDSDDLVNQVFGRFWRAMTPARFGDFPSLGGLLTYLKRCAQTVALDAGRRAEARQVKESALVDLCQADMASGQTSWAEQVLGQINREQLYAHVLEQVTSAEERLVFQASFEWNLNPRTIAERWSHLFADAREVSRVKERLLRRLRRDQEFRQLLKMPGEDGG